MNTEDDNEALMESAEVAPVMVLAAPPQYSHYPHPRKERDHDGTHLSVNRGVGVLYPGVLENL